MEAFKLEHRWLLTSSSSSSSSSSGTRVYPVVPITPFPRPQTNLDNVSVEIAWKFHSKMSLSRVLVANSNFTNSKQYGIGGFIYATSKNGFVFALNRDTGKVIWQQEVLRKGEDDIASGLEIVYFDDPITISTVVNAEENFSIMETKRKIVVHNEKIRQNLHSLTHSSFALIYGGIYAFDGLSGALLWKKSMDSSITKVPKVSRVNDNLSVLIGSRRSANVTCLEAVSGRMQWSVQLDGGTTSDFVVYSNSSKDTNENTNMNARMHYPEISVIYVGTSTAPHRSKAKDSLYRGCVYAIDAKYGKVLWRFNPSIFASFLAEPSLHFNAGKLSTIIAATSGDQPNHVFAIHHNSGQPKWRFTLEHTITNVIAKPIISNLYDLVLVCGNDGSVVALNVNNGTLKWVRVAAKAIIGTPSLVQYKDKSGRGKSRKYELMYIASLDGYIHALDIRLGDILWTYKSSSGAITSALSTLRQLEPNVEESQESVGTDDTIYYSDNYGFLFALHTTANEYAGDGDNSRSYRPGITAVPTPSPTMSIPSIAPASSGIDHTALTTMPSSYSSQSAMPSYHLVRESQSPTVASMAHSALSQLTNQDSSSLNTPALVAIVIVSAVFVSILVRYVLNFSKARVGKYSKVFVSDGDDLFHDAGSENVNDAEVMKSSKIKGVTNRNKSFMSMLTKQQNMNKVVAEPSLSPHEAHATVEGKEEDRKYDDILKQKPVSNIKSVSNAIYEC